MKNKTTNKLTQIIVTGLIIVFFSINCKPVSNILDKEVDFIDLKLILSADRLATIINDNSPRFSVKAKYGNKKPYHHLFN